MTPTPESSSPDPALAEFIARWSGVAAHERSNYVLFLTELCALLDLPRPDPAGAATAENAYVFERAVPLHHPDGKTTTGFIDLYRRGSFVLEAKQYSDAAPEQPEFALQLAAAAQRRAGIRRGSEAWDRAMLAARGQAENYARNLPANEEPPPFLIALDVGHTFALYADFTQKGKTYLPFPDARTYRIRLSDLARPENRERLRAVWLDPHSLDPAKKSAAVTREVAAHLAELARLLEHKHAPAAVASFLSRCLFCMFAEDIGLLPKEGFRKLLDSVAGDPAGAVPLLKKLFEEMNTGGYSVILREKLLHFNGGLFAESTVLPLDKLSLGLLRQAAALEWRHVEPAIFGTLLERALDPGERHKLGAHYTPRAYVERLVLPTVVEPLREEWEAVRAAAVTLATRGDFKGAIKQARTFHHELCAVRVLDPACGSGNFLYVTLEHMKRLEGEVLELIESLGENMRLDLAGETVDPHQFLGLEINPRAATVAELVLWIGYLQWHHRNRGSTEWPEPVLRAFKNVECRDAVLAYDRKEFAQEAHGNIRYVWDRRTMKTDPVTGRDVPDDKAVVPLETFINPRAAEWPQADFIVGNPPFLGKGERMREALGDGYVETLRRVYSAVPDSANLVMYWWFKAARETLANRTRRFGLITTNAIRQTFNRRVVQRALDEGLYLAFAIPDHPWVDTADGAAVRIAMTVGASTKPAPAGHLARVAREAPAANGENEVQLDLNLGVISADITRGINVTATVPLKSNEGISSPGMKLHGAGFIISPERAKELGLGRIAGLEEHIRPYRNGRDLTDEPRDVLVIDLFGLTAEEVRERFPEVYQHILRFVRPEREQNKRATYRENWWIHGEPRAELRPALARLPRYIATIETAKFRWFEFLAGSILPDNRLIIVASPDGFLLGSLSSRIHVVYALAAGGVLEDRPVYNKTRCFDPFPFPDCTEKQKAKIRALAEGLDAHRKRAQAEHHLGLTDIYNVLEKIRAADRPDSVEGATPVPPRPGRSPAHQESILTPKERAIHDAALVSTLKQLHDDLDAAVADAYGWPWPLTDAEILERIVALNAVRAAEEANGLVRWLRPEFQLRDQKSEGGSQCALPIEANTRDSKSRSFSASPSDSTSRKSKIENRKSMAKLPWPKTMPERTKAVDAALGAASAPVTAAELAQRFARARQADVAEILATLVALGRARPGHTQGTFVR